MSRSFNRPLDSDNHSLLARKEIKDSGRESLDASLKGSQKSQVETFPLSKPLGKASDEGKGIECVFPPRPFRANEQSEPLPVSETRSSFSSLWRPLAIAIAAGLFFLAIGRHWSMSTDEVINSGVELGSLVSRSFAQSRAEPLAQPMLNSTDADSTDSEIAKIIVTQAVPRPMDEAIPLGVSVRNSGDGDLLTIGGLVKGTMLSAGRAVGDNGWWLFATGLNNAVIRPPPHFVGAMEVAVELRLADTAFIDRRTLRFEWVKAEIPQVELKSEAQEAQPKTQPIHQLASEEIAALLKRGNDLISKGDLAAARLVLRRAAEAGDVHAAIALASTYDPMYLEKLELHGFSPDLAVARLWYEKAKELGSSDASKRLNMLAGRPN